MKRTNNSQNISSNKIDFKFLFNYFERPLNHPQDTWIFY